MKKGPGPRGSRDEEFLVPSLITCDHFQNVKTIGRVVPSIVHARKKKVTATPMPIASMV